MDALSLLVDSSGFPPRWQCGPWTAAHGWLHIIADLGVWSAYVAIPAVLGYFFLRRKDLPFRGIFLLFGAFILACGTTHLMEAILFWWPAYRLAGAIKLFTALVSWSTVIALVPVTPRALAMRSPTDLEREVKVRKATEESLRQSEELFRLLVEGTLDYAIFMLDPQGYVVSWNAGAQRINGYRADEIIGQHFARFFSKDDVQPGQLDDVLHAAERGGRHEDEGWRVRKDGSKYWANVIITALRDSSGRLKGFLKITRDVTERKRVEEALRSSEERFRAVTQSIHDAVISADAAGKIVFWNRSAQSIFGYTEAEVLDQPLAMLMPESYRQAHQAGLERFQATGESRVLGRVIELEGRRKDGGEFPVELSLAAWKTGQGQFFSGVLRDITQRKQAEEALETSRRFVERIAEMMPSILYVYDLKERHYLFLNQRIESLLGYSGEEVQLPQVPALLNNVHPDDQAKMEWANEQYQTAEDGAVIELEYRIRHADGRWRWLHGRNTIFVRDSEGNPSQILGTAQDITDRKRLEQEVLEVAASEQRRIGQELHDGTGQELTGLCMLASNLAGALTSRSPDEAQAANRIAQGLRDSLGQVRALSRGLIPVEVDAEGLMASLTELTDHISELHGVRCVFRCIDPVPMDDNYAATQLFRIAQEAITNAIKHGRADNINVSLEAKGAYITLRIADDGVGLPNNEETTEGMGLRIMRYRAGQIGAHFTVRPGSTSGAVVSCTLVRRDSQ